MILLALLACDDDIFPPADHGAIVEGDSYDDVVAVFDGDCLSCHSAAAKTAGLDLETDPCAAIVDVVSPNYGLTEVVPGDHAASLLWNKIAQTDPDTYGGVMPPGGALPEASLDTVAAWIDAGASCGADGDTATSSYGAEP